MAVRTAVIGVAVLGSIGVQLGQIAAAARTALAERGVGFAELIPDVDRTIVVAQSDALPAVRLGYGVAVAAGAWLPWVALVFLAAGVLVARRRVRALVIVAWRPARSRSPAAHGQRQSRSRPAPGDSRMHADCRRAAPAYGWMRNACSCAPRSR